MNLFGMLQVSGSAMTAERQRAEIVTANMANAETTRTAEGGPYKRKLAVFRSEDTNRFPRMLTAGLRQQSAGVRVEQVVADQSPPEMRFEPGHPDADAQGFVAYPNINPVNEMVDLMSAVRAYELNSQAVQATKGMIADSLELLK
jgi:flagellar basal-body rod protein FlgC